MGRLNLQSVLDLDFKNVALLHQLTQKRFQDLTEAEQGKINELENWLCDLITPDNTDHDVYFIGVLSNVLQWKEGK